MRNVKFRVWDIVDKKLNYSDVKYFLISLNGDVVDGNGVYYDELHVIQQFTGLTDKNNQEIYEGDVVKISDKKLNELYLYDEPVEVIWDYFSFGLKCKDKVGNKEFVGLSNFEGFDLEVVGNIFEK